MRDKFILAIYVIFGKTITDLGNILKCKDRIPQNIQFLVSITFSFRQDMKHILLYFCQKQGNIENLVKLNLTLFYVLQFSYINNSCRREESIKYPKLLITIQKYTLKQFQLFILLYIIKEMHSNNLYKSFIFKVIIFIKLNSKTTTKTGSYGLCFRLSIIFDLFHYIYSRI